MGNLVKPVPSLNEKVPMLNSLLPILSELTSLQNNENVITPVAVCQLSQTPLDELILPPVLVSMTPNGYQKTFNYNEYPPLIEFITEIEFKQHKNWTLIFGNV